MWILWGEFIFCASLIVLTGTYLSRYGDIIAEKVGLGRAWIGVILMAGVTSLPELITGISSVAMAHVPDIAIGDIMGSCVFNMSIIALADILHGPAPIFYATEHGHILSAGFGVILIGITSISLLVNQNIPSISWIGIYTPVIIFIYLIGIRSVFQFEKRKIAEFIDKKPELIYEDIPLRQAVFKYIINAAVIIGAATWLPYIGEGLARETGLGQSFVGTIFIAMATSLPEIVVSIAALKIGAVDMVVANLFGSNMFNILILAIDDIFYTPGPLLSHVSPTHAVTGFIAVMMTGITIVSLTYRLEKKAFLRLGWDSIAIILSYLVNIYLMYSLRK